MADATPKVAVSDQIVDIDLDEIKIRPMADNRVVYYRLRETWASGAVTYRERTIHPDHFAAFRDSFLQAAWRKKMLTWLVDNDYEPNISPA